MMISGVTVVVGLIFVGLVQMNAAQMASNGSQPAAAPKAKVGKVGAVSCYQCNSDSDAEKDCAGSDTTALKKYLNSCPKLTEGTFGGNEANSCRKVMQDVGDDKRGVATIRECAYTGDTPVDGRRRTGNKGIITKTYQCFNEDNSNPCNASPATLKAVALIFIPLLVLLFIF